MPTTTGTTASSPAGGGHGPGRAVAYGPPDLEQRYANLLLQVKQDWRTYRPSFPHPSASLWISDHDDKDRDDMYTQMAGRNACAITVLPTFYASDPAPTDQEARQILAHEYFHCIQGAWQGDADITGPDWLVEGSADWASFDLYSPHHLPISIYLKWFTSPGTPLGARSYDAWPLYQAIAQDDVIDPYQAIRVMLQSGVKGVKEMLAAGGLDNPEFAIEAAGEAFRPTLWSDHDATWRTHWPGPDVDAGPTDNGVVLKTRGIGTYPIHSRGGFSHIPGLVPMTDAVGVVRVLGKTGPMVTHTHQGTVTVAEGQMRFFCVRDYGCECPPGMSPNVPLFTVSRPMMFSFPQRETRTVAAVRAEKWNPKKYCRQSPQTPHRDGDSNGDPHLVTFDGLHYDLMALGEFVAVRDPTGDLQVQTRHEAFPTWGSGTTAVAIGTGTHRITITSSGLAKDASTLVRVDGRPRSGPADFDVGDVLVHTEGPTVTVVWPDTSYVQVTWAWGYFVHISLAADRASRVVGLLGTANHDFMDDLRLPDGSRPTDPDPNGSLAKAWYVTDATSLFDYRPGQDTESFRKPPPPVPPPADPAVRRQCTRTLGTNATSFEIAACEFDITVTDDFAVADAYFHVVTVRLADLPQQVSGAPQTHRRATTATGTSTGTGPPAPTNSAGSGTAALSLNGIITSVPSGPGVKAALTGSLTLVGGTVLIAKTPACPKGVSILVTVTRRSSGSSAQVYACDPTGKDHFDTDEGDESPSGEGYLWIPSAGNYDVTVETFSTDQVPVSMHFYADPTPTMVSAAQFTDSGWSGSLSGIGDTVVLWAPNPAGSDVITWHYTGSAGLCRSLLPVDQSQKDPVDATGLCRHQAQLSLYPAAGTQTPIVVFSRTAGTATATFHAKG